MDGEDTDDSGVRREYDEMRRELLVSANVAVGGAADVILALDSFAVEGTVVDEVGRLCNQAPQSSTPINHLGLKAPPGFKSST